MVLGIIYLTKVKLGEPGEGKIFGDKEEALTAYQHGKVDLHAIIQVRGVTGIGKLDPKNLEDRVAREKCEKNNEFTTVGRIIFFDILPKNVDPKNITGISARKTCPIWSMIVLKTQR